MYAWGCIGGVVVADRPQLVTMLLKCEVLAVCEVCDGGDTASAVVLGCEEKR